MERIQNIDTLESVLSNEDPLWQRRVFEETGVAVFPANEKRPYWELVSSCGLADLDDDTDGLWVNGRDESSYCEISSVEHLVTYIKRMDTYTAALKDVDLGGYNKSDLFWAIHARIMDLNRYPDDDLYMGGCPIFGMKQIVGPGGASLIEMDQNDLWFRTSLVGVDEIGIITKSLSDKPSLDEMVDFLAGELKRFWNGTFRYDRNVAFAVPKTYEDIVRSRNVMCF